MSTLKQLSEYAEMEAIKADLGKLRKDSREKWDKSQDVTSGRMLLSTIRTRIALGRFELHSHIKTGTPPSVGMFNK